MKWFCTDEISPEFADVIEADTSQEAAEEYFKNSDCNEMSQQNEKTVYVFADIEGKPEIFEVVRDFEPYYNAYIPNEISNPLEEVTA